MGSRFQESQLLHDAPSLLAKFRMKCLREKVTKWNRKWTEPERLLHKRLVVLPESSDECTLGSLYIKCNTEHDLPYLDKYKQYDSFSPKPFLYSARTFSGSWDNIQRSSIEFDTAQDSIINIRFGSGWGEKHRLFVKWKCAEAKKEKKRKVDK